MGYSLRKALSPRRATTQAGHNTESAVRLCCNPQNKIYENISTYRIL